MWILKWSNKQVYFFKTSCHLAVDIMQKNYCSISKICLTTSVITVHRFNLHNHDGNKRKYLLLIYTQTNLHQLRWHMEMSEDSFDRTFDSPADDSCRICSFDGFEIILFIFLSSGLKRDYCSFSFFYSFIIDFKITFHNWWLNWGILKIEQWTDFYFHIDAY